MIKLVDFYPYCERCVHEKNLESAEPCCFCLSAPARGASHRPLYFEPKEDQNETDETRGS